jgi:hypothetical protein
MKNEMLGAGLESAYEIMVFIANSVGFAPELYRN